MVKLIKPSVLKKISLLLSKNGWDALMVTPSADFRLLVNFDLVMDERLLALFITKSCDAFIVGPNINKEEISEHFGGKLPFYLWDDSDWFHNTVAKTFEDFNLTGGKIALSSSVLANKALDIAYKNSAELFNGDCIMEEIRLRKDAEELKNLRMASEIADKVMLDLQYFLKPGLTEKELASWVVKRYLELGGSRRPGDIPLVASGPNGAIGHYDKGLRTIQDNDVVVVDSGCGYNGYQSDTTRTFFVGQPTKKQRDIFNIVREAEHIGELTVRPGVMACEVDMAVRRYIIKQGYGELFYHRTGHGIGMEGHERPYISASDRTILEPGMCFSIEPGIYCPGEFGVRLENIVAVTETGHEALNKASMHLRAIKS
ncbi:MAG: Xaa-Pro peptidase family protein [Tannerellaceae bacterium]